MEFSQKEFWIIKKGKRTGPVTLKEIRRQLAKGNLNGDQKLVDVKSKLEKTVKEVVYEEIGLRRKSLTRYPPLNQGNLQLVVFFILTLGLYLYFWFHRIYREMRNFKGIQVNPELRVLGLFALTIVPFYIYGQVSRSMDGPDMGGVEWALGILVSGLEGGFIFTLLKIIFDMIKRQVKPEFNPLAVAGFFFLLGSLKRCLPLDLSFYWWAILLIITLQAMLLAWVQRDLNRFWQRQRDQWSGRT